MKRFQAWRSRKSRSSSQQAANSSCITAPILNLPTEILSLIVLHQNYESALSFSLTCRYLYDMFFVSIQAPYINQRIIDGRFLRLIERDTADYLLCAFHGKLYQWRKQRSNLYQCRKCRTDSCNSTNTALCGNRCGILSYQSMNVSIRSLMLRHAIHGPKFGVPAHKFNHTCSTVGESHNQVELKVVDQKLMVRRTLKVMVIMDHFSNLVHDSSYQTLCPHNKLAYESLLCAAVNHVSAARKQNSKSNQWSCPLLFKCKRCATDMKLSVNQGSRRTAAIEFDVYQDLGGLNNPSHAQLQVLREVRNNVPLNMAQQKQRMREDLSKQFFSSDEQKTLPGKSPDRTFLDQWGQAADVDRWALNFTDTAQLTPIWAQYRSLPLKLLKG